MKIPSYSQNVARIRSRSRGLTMLEILVVVFIIGLLTGLGYAAVTQVVQKANTMKTMNNLRSITLATMDWTVENGDHLPSPIYTDDTPGELPENAMLMESGMWLDGVIFATLYPGTDPANTASSRATEGGHLVETVFESTPSVKRFPTDTNWYHHSYAMNKNLRYDEINANAPDPYLTEKTRVNFTRPVDAMIYIDCMEKNVVAAEDVMMIRNTKARHDDRFVLAAFLDAHVDKLHPNEIPESDSTEDGSKFWRGAGLDD